jgi:hypothetical protein
VTGILVLTALLLQVSDAATRSATVAKTRMKPPGARRGWSDVAQWALVAAQIVTVTGVVRMPVMEERAVRPSRAAKKPPTPLAM